MQHLKNFKPYKPENHPMIKILGETTLFLLDEDGNDWYDVQTIFETSTVKVLYDSRNVVVDSNTDITMLVPYNCSVLELDAKTAPTGELRDNYVVKDGVLKKRTVSPEKLQEDFEIEKKTRIENAQKVLQGIELAKKHSLNVVSDELQTEWEVYFVSLLGLSYTKGVTFSTEPKSPF